MKKLVLILLVLLACAISTNAQQLLAQFDSENFTNWKYNGTKSLNFDNIQNRKIYIYGNYTLTSPVFSCQNVQAIDVETVIYSEDYLQESYSYYDASPYFELLNEKDSVVARVHYNYTDAQQKRTVYAKIIVPSGSDQVKFRLTAADASLNSAGAVLSVNVYGNTLPQTLTGDVNGDGLVDVSDVSDLMAMILGNKVVNKAADVNGDGIIDVSDATSLIKIILG